MTGSHPHSQRLFGRFRYFRRPFSLRVRASVLGVLMLVAPQLAAAAENTTGASGLWSLGLQTRGFIDLEPGNDYLTGFDAGYSPSGFLRHRLELRAAYLTSRPEAAFRNVLRQDWFLFSPVWHFRRHRFFDPTVQLDLGWYRYDVENEAIFGDLENSAGIRALQVGFELHFLKRYAFRYSLGYQTAGAASSIVYPLPFTAGLTVTVP